MPEGSGSEIRLKEEAKAHLIGAIVEKVALFIIKKPFLYSGLLTFFTSLFSAGIGSGVTTWTHGRSIKPQVDSILFYSKITYAEMARNRFAIEHIQGGQEAFKLYDSLAEAQRKNKRDFPQSSSAEIGKESKFVMTRKQEDQ